MNINSSKISFCSETCENVYAEIDKSNVAFTEIQELHDKLLSQAILFKITQPEPGILESTRHYLRLNKQLWDFVFSVSSCINLWQSTLWINIDSEFMDMELKRFSKILKCILTICFKIQTLFL